MSNEKRLERIEDMVRALLMRGRESDLMPSMPLDGMLHALECHQSMYGITCCSVECDFNLEDLNTCGLKHSVIRQGKCSQYKPKPSDAKADRGSKSPG